MGKAVVESEVQKLRREKDLLMQEVMQLREEHLITAERMDSVNQCMQSAVLKQKPMVSFLAKVLQKPTFLGHLKQLKRQKVASIRGKRKFIKHHQLQPIFSASAEPMNQQLVKYAESGEGSDAFLHVFELSEGNQFPEHLLKDITDKLDLDTVGGEVIGGSSETEEHKGKNILNPQMDCEFSGSDCLISLPEDVANLETDYISQVAIFLDAIALADVCVSARAWNVSLDSGGSMLSSEPAVWDDSLGHYNDARKIEYAAGSCRYGILVGILWKKTWMLATLWELNPLSRSIKMMLGG